MKKRFSIFLILVSLLLLFSSQVLASETNGRFHFIHFTDAHLGSGVGNKNMPLGVEDIKNNFSYASFLVGGGDQVEFGTPKEYEYYKSLINPLEMNKYYIPGNHEARWTDAGKGYFKRYFNHPYLSWDYEGIHFVALDSTIAKSQHGHLEKQMLMWLTEDLKKVEKEMPIVLFSHHPIFWDEATDYSKYMDNDWDLWQVIKDYNVSAIFTGHGHLNLKWNVNDIPVFMTKSVMEGGYKLIEVNKERQEMRVFNRLFLDNTMQLESTLSLTKNENRPNIKILSPNFNGQYQNSLKLVASLENLATESCVVEYKMEDYKWKPLEFKGNTYEKEIDLTNIDDGSRTFWVRATTKDGKCYIDRVKVNVQNSSKVKVKWNVDLNGGVQHAPVIDEKKVYVGDNSGYVYALDKNTGTKIWEYKTGGSIIASPSISNGNVYVGSSDGNIYALDINGKKLWNFKTNGAVIASPLVVNQTVYIGSSDFNMYALDVNSGQLKWKFNTGNTIMSKPVLKDNTLYFGSWDRKFYAVDANTGLEKWRKELASQGYYAPATSDPVYIDGKVIFSTPASFVYAFDGVTGEELWKVKERAGLSTPIIDNNLVVYNNSGGTVFALNPLNGERMWEVDTKTYTYESTPLLHGSNAILSGMKAKVSSINRQNNPAFNWSFKIGDTYLFRNGAALNNNFYIGSLEGKIVCLEF